METGFAAAERQQSFRGPRGEGAIVFDPTRVPQATPDLLEPAWWGDAAVPVASGGRGAAWFVRGAFGDGVLRRYRRGGVAARISREHYVWLGTNRVRSLAEFRLLSRLRALHLPVPAPLVAGWWRVGASYRAAILVQRIAGARPLAAWLDAGVDAAPWERAGATIAEFHRHGACHPDLNANNVLVDAEDRVWLIDFDRGRQRDPAAGWRLANLDRLQRSLVKLSPGEGWRDGWSRLRRAYDRTLAGAVA